MKKKIWLAISALTMLSAGASAVSISSLGDSYKSNQRPSVSKGSSSAPSYQVQSEPESKWGPNLDYATGTPAISLDKASGSPKIALDNAYGNIKNTSGVSSDIKKEMEKNTSSLSWIRARPTGAYRPTAPYHSLSDFDIQGKSCNHKGKEVIANRDSSRYRCGGHSGRYCSRTVYTRYICK